MMRITTIFLLAITLISGGALAQDQKKARGKPLTDDELLKLAAKSTSPPHGPSFYIEPVNTTVSLFSVLLSDENNRTVAGNFTPAQIAVYEAVLTEAIRFAQSEEGIGQTSRFVDKHEKDFIVDIEKTPKWSKFYVTLSYMRSRVTVDCGTIIRAEKDHQKALAFDILDHIKAARAEAASK